MSNVSPPENPGYYALRLGADWASAVRGNTLFFSYADGILQLQEQASDTVPVSTAPSAASRPAIQSVTLDAGDYGSLTLPNTEYPMLPCCALFWSESAVEKFLFPYYASASGFHAQAVLYAISTAWYNYYDSMPVCALAFMYPTDGMQGAALSLWDTVGVVWSSAPGVLQLTPLLSYLQSAPPLKVMPFLEPTVMPDQSVPASDAWSSINNVVSREIAEYASGLRGSEVWFYGAEEGVLARLSPRDDSADLLFQADAPLWREGRPTVTVTVQGEEIGSVLLQGPRNNAANLPDAVFWSDGAVDMLLAPYYASVQAQWSPLYLALLLGTWSGLIPPGLATRIQVVEGIRHAADRQLHDAAKQAGGDGAEVGMTLEETSSQVFAIIHLPRSEWIDEYGVDIAAGGDGETIWLEHRTAMLTAGGDMYPLTPPPNRLISR